MTRNDWTTWIMLAIVVLGPLAIIVLNTIVTKRRESQLVRFWRAVRS